MLIILLTLAVFVAVRASFDAIECRHRRRGLADPTTIEELRRGLGEHPQPAEKPEIGDLVQLFAHQ